MPGFGVITKNIAIKNIEIEVSMKRSDCRVIHQDRSIFVYWNTLCQGEVTLKDSLSPETKPLTIPIHGYLDLLQIRTRNAIASWLPKSEQDVTAVQIMNAIAPSMLFPVRDDANPNDDATLFRIVKETFVTGSSEIALDRYGRPIGKYKLYVARIPFSVKRETGGIIRIDAMFTKHCPYVYDAASIKDFTVSAGIEIEQPNGEIFTSPHFKNMKRAGLPLRMKQWLRAQGVTDKEIELVKQTFFNEQWLYFEMVVDQVLQGILNKKLKPK